MNKTQKIILVSGTTLIALRLIFPVLICVDPYICKYGPIIFFTFNHQSAGGYSIYTTRTYTQSIALGLITLVMFFVFNNKNKNSKKNIKEKTSPKDNFNNNDNVQNTKESITTFTTDTEIKLKENEVFADIFERCGARIIDILIILIVDFLIFLIGVVLGLFSVNNQPPAYFWYIIYGIYETLLIYFNSATVGKRLFNLRVVSYYTNKKIFFWKSLLRFIFLSLPLVPLTILFDEKSHRGWHDNLVDTVVIRDKSKSNTLGIGLAIIGVSLIIAGMIITKANRVIL